MEYVATNIAICILVGAMVLQAISTLAGNPIVLGLQWVARSIDSISEKLIRMGLSEE